MPFATQMGSCIYRLCLQRPLSAQIGSSSTSCACKDQFQHKWALYPPFLLAKTNFSTNRLFIHQLCLQRPLLAQIGSSSTVCVCEKIWSCQKHEPSPGPTQGPHIRVLSLVHAADYLPFYSARVKHEWSYTSTPRVWLWHGR